MVYSCVTATSWAQVFWRFQMDSHHTAVAQYGWRLDGDVTEDCTVNILDMIYVRNRLNETCSE